jgi:hypothetical protein
MASDDILALVTDSDLISSPRVTGALEDFVVEAIEEATDLLKFGDMATRTQLIRLILSMALKSKDSAASEDAERILAQTRATLAGVVD